MADGKTLTRTASFRQAGVPGGTTGTLPAGQAPGVPGTNAGAQVSGPPTRSVRPAPGRPAVSSQGPQIASATSTAAAAGNGATQAPFLPMDNAGSVTSGAFAGGGPGAGSDPTAGIDWRELRQAVFGSFTHALEIWKLQARFSNVLINGPLAVGQPGCLDGPALASYSNNPATAGLSGASDTICRQMLGALSDSFGLWQMGVFMPGLMLFPSLAAFPGPVAPPMPALPFTLAMLPSAYSSALTKNSLRSAFRQHLAAFGDSEPLLRFTDNIALSTEMTLGQWRATAVASGVLGGGPVPSYRPPFVPVGPVVAGEMLPVPCFTGISNPNFVNLPDEIYMG